METCVVYQLTFPNGKSYIGVTHNLERRFIEHSRSETPCGHAIRKYGQPEIKTLVIAERQYCYEIESKLTRKLKTVVPLGYNLQEGGMGGSVPSKETKQRMRAAAKRKNPVTDIARERMSKAQLDRSARGLKPTPPPFGYRHSEETKAKMSASNLKRWAENSYPVTEQTKARMAVGQQKRTDRQSPEYRANISQAAQKSWDAVDADGNPVRSRKASPETREKMRVSAFNRHRKAAA